MKTSSYKSVITNTLAYIFICVTFFTNYSFEQSLSFQLDKNYKHGDPEERVLNLTKSMKISELNTFLTDDKEIEKDIINYKDVQYYSTLYIGDQKEEFTFIFDTGSEWLWLPSNLCLNWRDTAKKYTATSSTVVSKDKNTIQYLSARVFGDIGTDIVRATPDDENGVNMKIMLITSEEGTEGTVSDGIVGLTPGVNNGSDLFITKLFDAGLISENTFGLNINPSPDNSKLIIGGYDKSIIGENPTFAYVPLRSTDDWRVTLNRLKYNNQTFYAKGGVAVFDCGTSVTTFEVNMFNALLAQLFQGHSWFYIKDGDYQGYFGWQCASYNDFQNITFQLGDYDFFWTSKQYIKETDIDAQHSCVFMFHGKDLGNKNIDYVLLGANFFYDFYIYHDVTNKQIGLFGDYVDAPDAAFNNLGISYLLIGAIASLLLLN